MGKALVAHGNGSALTTVNADFSAFGSTGGVVGATATETNFAYPMPAAGTFSGLSAGGISGTWSATFRKNGASGNQTISNSAPTDTTHTDSVIAGDKIDLVWGAGGGTVTTLQCVFQATSSHWVIYSGNNISAGSNFNAGTTTFPRLTITPGPTATESLTQVQVGAAGVLSGLAVLVNSNAATSPSTMVFRKNGGTGNQTVTVGAGLTGIFQDTTNTDSIAQNDLINLRFVNGGGGAIQIIQAGCGFQNASAPANDVSSSAGNVVAGATDYFRIFGSSPVSSTESPVQMAHGFLVTLSRMAVFVNTNATTSPSTLKLRKNGGNGNQTITIGAGLTGWFTDTTHTDTAGPTDLINYQGINGGGGTISMLTLTMMEESLAFVSAPAATTPKALITRGRNIVAKTTPAAHIQKQTNKLLSSALTGSYLQLHDANSNLTLMEGTAFDGRYVYCTPHSNWTVAKIDPLLWAQGAANAVVATVDLTTITGGTPGGANGAFFGCGIMAGNLYIYPHSHSGIAKQTIVQISLANFDLAHTVGLDLKTCGIGVVSTSSWTGAALDGSRYLYIGLTDPNHTIKGAMVRVDTTNFTSTGAAIIDLTNSFTGLGPVIACTVPLYDPATARVYFDFAYKFDGVNTQNSFCWLDTTNFSLSGITFGPLLGTLAAATWFVDATRIWNFNNNQIERYDKTTLAVIDTIDLTAYGAQAKNYANYPIYDGTRYAYAYQFNGGGGPWVTVLDTQNPSKPYFYNLTNIDPLADGYSGMNCSDGNFIYLAPFDGSNGRLVRFKMRLPTDSFGLPGIRAFLVRGRNLLARATVSSSLRRAFQKTFLALAHTASSLATFLLPSEANSCPVLFNRDVAWTIPIYGPTINSVTYDPLHRTLQLNYQNDTFAQYQPVGAGLNITLTNAPDPEAVVMQAISGATQVGMPSSFIPPTIFGATVEGQVLVARPGTWCYAPTSFAYQWFRNGSAVGGQTAISYTLGPADLGATMTVQITATNPFGSSAPTLSLPVGPVSAT